MQVRPVLTQATEGSVSGCSVWFFEGVDIVHTLGVLIRSNNLLRRLINQITRLNVIPVGSKNSADR
jgi:hypothetical protein